MSEMDIDKQCGLKEAKNSSRVVPCVNNIVTRVTQRLPYQQNQTRGRTPHPIHRVPEQATRCF